MPSLRGGDSEADGGAGAASAALPPLPCLNRNNSTEDALTQGIQQLTGGHRKSAFALKENVARMCKEYGVERVGFLTLTFADHVTCAKEAGRRFNSLRSHVLCRRYAESIAVLERQKSGRIHFHLLVALPVDIRTGFSFEQAERGVYTSANGYLRSEWAFWRATARAYGFGRTELMPVKSNEEGLAKYVGKYVAKHIGQREERDKGVRLVRYSKGARRVGTQIAWVSPRAWLWRAKLAAFARSLGCLSMDDLKLRLGPKWAYRYRDIIAAESLTHYPSGHHAIADGAASALDFEERGVDVNSPVSIESLPSVEDREWRQRYFRRQLDRLPEINARRARDEEGELEVTRVWSDGRVDRLGRAARRRGSGGFSSVVHG